MRWWSAVFPVLLAFVSVKSNAVSASYNGTVTAAVSASVLGPGDAARALQAVVMAVLDTAGVVAVPAPTPFACDVPDDTACLTNTLAALVTGKTATVAIVAVPAKASLPIWELHESGVEILGDVTVPSRRACLTTSPPARSLLDLVDASVAASYNVPEEDIERLTKTCNQPSCNETITPEWCTGRACATLLTSRESEAKVLWHEVQKHHLYAVVRPLGEHLSKVTSVLATRPIIACDWAPELTSLSDLQGETLGPPPCLSYESCPFETRRLVKFINMRELARSESAVRALVRLNISKEDMRKLAEEASIKGPEKAARAYIEAQPPSASTNEVRIAVLLPKNTSREAYNALDLAAAAAFADEVVNKERKATTPMFKVEVFDDRCHTQGAYKYLIDAPGTGEFGALSALAGPACGAAWADVAKQSAVHNLPVLAYTLQAPASSPHDTTDTRLQLLAAGDARQLAAALAALIAQLGWKRVAAINEPSTRPLLEAIKMKAKLVVHTEVPENGSNIGLDAVQHWVSSAVNESARILYLCVEDARIARAALCAARTAGLTPSAGAVWLTCNTNQPNWLEARVGENCTTQQLKEVAEGHFTVSPEWALTWQNTTNGSETRRDWERGWRTHCYRLTQRSTMKECETSPGPNAAMLFDTVHQWASALYRLMKQFPNAIDDLHNLHYVKFLVNDTTSTEFTGVTGPINWTTADGAYARVSSLILLQWSSKEGARNVGTWNKGLLELDDSAINWYTADGNIPDDGSEKCSLQGLADALHADCRTAFVALGALLVAILVAALAATALHCKRRTEKEYRKRLQALGMRPLAIKPVGLDRWEIARERVVINRKLGTGAFGTVYGGHALLAEDKGWSAVAVKTLKAGATTEEKLDFLSEAEAMKRFDHKNVVRLLGVVTKTEPVCTVMEFMLYGDLKNYLLARRHLAMGGGIEESEGLEADEASPRRLTGMALDVARALSYLAQLRYVHRDVAARNCLVSARRVVKLADFGMTRLVFENDYYRFSRKGMLPVRWMAPESLALGVFSPASDVWSFGVLLYEIVTFGSLPFQGLSNSEVLTQVKGGHTLDLPLGLKSQLEGLIKSCWQQDPKKRPTASEVAAYLADAPRLLSPCLDVPLDAMPLDADPPWRLPRDQAEARWVSWAAPASAATDTTYLSTDGAVPLDTDSFLP